MLHQHACGWVRMLEHTTLDVNIDAVGILLCILYDAYISDHNGTKGPHPHHGSKNKMLKFCVKKKRNKS